MGSRSESRSPSPSHHRNGRSRSRSKGRGRIRSSEDASRSRSPSPSRSPPRRTRRVSRSRSRSISPESCGNETIRMAWREIKKDKDNFDAWMHILNLADQLNDLPIARDIYDRFLAKYPFCYGFWKKYAEMERRNKKFPETISVWERGIVAIPLSVDLWLGFLAFMREMAPQSEEGVTKMKQMYDRALSVAGVEFTSDRLWNDAIAWEEARGDWRAVSKIYDRLLQTPTQLYKSHYERYETIINLYEPDLLLHKEEYDEIFSLVKKHLNMGIDQIIFEQEVIDEPFDANEDTDMKPTIRRVKKHNPDALAFFRAEIMARRRRWHEKNTAMVATRLPFEEQIKRPYFHVKSLEKQQVQNWRQYLDFEIEEGDEKRIQTLFNRCVIACAMYDEFWLRYARWANKKKGGQDTAKKIYSAALIHCPKSVSLVLAMSAFEEAQGTEKTTTEQIDISDIPRVIQIQRIIYRETDAAIAILDKFDRKNPGYAAIDMRRIGIHRRTAERDRDSKPDYSDVVSMWEKLIHNPDTTRHMGSFYSIKLARFHLISRNDRRLAEKVIGRALERDRDNIQLHLQLIDLAYSDPEYSQTKVLEAFNAAVHSKLSDEDRLRLSQRKLDFLEDVSYDINDLQEHYEQHHRLVRSLEKPSSTTRKRRYEPAERRYERDSFVSSRGRDGRYSDRHDGSRRDYHSAAHASSYGVMPPQQQQYYMPPQQGYADASSYGNVGVAGYGQGYAQQQGYYPSM